MRRSSCCAIPSWSASRWSSAAAGATSPSCCADGTRALRHAWPTTRAAAWSPPPPTPARDLGVHSGMGLMKAALRAPQARAAADRLRPATGATRAASRPRWPRSRRYRGPRHRRDLHRPHARCPARRTRVGHDPFGGVRAVAQDIRNNVRARHRPELLDRRHAEQAAVEDRQRARQARRADAADPRRPARAHLAAAGAAHQRHRAEGRRQARSAGHHTHRRARRARARLPGRALRPRLRRWLHDAAHGRRRPAGGHLERPGVDEPRDDLRPRPARRCATAPSSARIFTELVEQLARDLQRKGYAGRTIGIKLRFDDFKTVTRDLTLPHPADDAPRSAAPPACA